MTILANQPSGAGAGTPGVASEDLWVGQAVNLSSTVASPPYLWELLDRPPGSASTLSTPTAITSSFIPDVVGSYRIQLTTALGVFILTYRARFSASGVLLNRGWALPAIGELPNEANYGGNTRSYAQVFESILGDILIELDGFGKYTEIPLSRSDLDTRFTGFVRAGMFQLDLSKYPATSGIRAREIKLKAIVAASGALDGGGIVPWVCQVRLYDSTHGVVVGGSTIDGPTVNVTTPALVSSAALTVGASAGNLRSDAPAIYEVQFRALGAGVLSAPDDVSLYQSILTVEYV